MTAPTTASPISYDLEEAARLVGLSARELKRAAKAGDLTLRYRGRKPVVEDSELRAFIANLPTTAPKAASPD